MSTPLGPLDTTVITRILLPGAGDWVDVVPGTLFIFNNPQFIVLGSDPEVPDLVTPGGLWLTWQDSTGEVHGTPAGSVLDTIWTPPVPLSQQDTAKEAG